MLSRESKLSLINILTEHAERHDVEKILEVTEKHGYQFNQRCGQMSVSFLLGQKCDDAIRAFLTQHDINFDLYDYARGVGYSGDINACRKIIAIDQNAATALTHGAASAGNFTLAHQLLSEHKLNILIIAKGAASGGYLTYCEHLRIKYQLPIHDLVLAAVSSVSFAYENHGYIYCQGAQKIAKIDLEAVASRLMISGRHEYVWQLLSENAISNYTEIAQCAVFSGHTFHAKKLIETYPVDITEVALASVDMQLRDFTNYLLSTYQTINWPEIFIHSVSQDWKYAEAMRTAFNINEEIVIRLAVNIGNDHYCQQLIKQNANRRSLATQLGGKNNKKLTELLRLEYQVHPEYILTGVNEYLKEEHLSAEDKASAEAYQHKLERLCHSFKAQAQLNLNAAFISQFSIFESNINTKGPLGVDYPDHCSWSDLLETATKLLKIKPSKDNIFFCPISGQLINQPVIASDGKVYDKHSLLKYFQKHLQKGIMHPPSIITHTPLALNKISPHRKLARTISKNIYQQMRNTQRNKVR